MVLTSEGKPIVLSKGEDISTKLGDAIEVRVPIR
jgi:IMP dehydrogenase/GMP reductase